FMIGLLGGRIGYPDALGGILPEGSRVRHEAFEKRRRPGLRIDPGTLNYPGNDLLSHAVTSAVPSALEGLTSVFGMGTGVAPPASPPGIEQQANTLILECSQATNEHECNRGQAARPISTAKLNASRRLHLRPINLVIFQGPSEGLRPGRSHLEAGFALRC